MEYYKKEYKSDFLLTPEEKKNICTGGGAIHIDQKIIKNKKILIGGLGGSLWYNGDKTSLRKPACFLRIMKMIPACLINRLIYGRFIDIFVSHSPPFGINDGEGPVPSRIQGLPYFLMLFRPRFHIHGHIHLYGTGNAESATFHKTQLLMHTIIIFLIFSRNSIIHPALVLKSRIRVL